MRVKLLSLSPFHHESGGPDFSYMHLGDSIDRRKSIAFQVEVLHPVSGVVLANVRVPTLADSAMEGSKRTREDASDSVCGIHLFKKSSFW